ncbi:hypothetical protein A5707_14200 [Mycobacterium kyorinense]|uniref:DUF4190 domain-containing protein n=1 Tax=Mycobacterium kyorinense TaxID=487514 RepID=A0A1A2ZPF6_9MYCO|nr:DUF4190 domain-containing protein [Mycobacterium kyorinense]OBI50961.1 hypothetical protein A5707_14200 [Mycobacterium kyorinense]
MTEFPDGPSERPETPEKSTETGTPYQYPYQPGGYLPPGHTYFGYPAPPVTPRNGLGVVALVVAIVGLAMVWSVFGGVILGIAAVAVGFFGWSRAKRGQANNGGVAIAGIALGVVAIVVGLAFIPIWLTLWKDVGGDTYFDCLENAGSNRIRQQQCADQFREKVQNHISGTLTTPPPTP